MKLSPVPVFKVRFNRRCASWFITRHHNSVMQTFNSFETTNSHLFLSKKMMTMTMMRITC